MSAQDETVVVNKAALEELIEYANDARRQRDSEFCVGRDAHRASDEEYDGLVAALDIREGK